MMEAITVLLIFALLLVASAVAVCLAIYKHKSQQETESTIAREAQSKEDQPPDQIGSSEPAQTILPEPPVIIEQLPELAIPREAEHTEGEETQPQTDVEDQLATTAERTKQTVIEGTQLPASTEAKSSVVENVQPQANEKSRPTGPETQAKSRKRRLEPIHRGGRPRGIPKGARKYTRREPCISPQNQKLSAGRKRDSSLSGWKCQRS
jgi:hypothetical protein